MAPHGKQRPSFGDEEEPDFRPPGVGFELYRHKHVEMRTKNWHGHYWARRTDEGDYEIRTVPSSLGESPALGGQKCVFSGVRNVQAMPKQRQE